MNFELYDYVELATDVPNKKGIQVGASGRIVEIRPHRKAYCVEFEGAVLNVPGSALRFVRHIRIEPTRVRKRSTA